MGNRQHNRPARYRVWIVTYAGRRPEDCRSTPAEAVALEPAEEGSMSAAEARRYVDAFNRAATAGRPRVWAVAVPVTIHYHGDLQPGQPLDRFAVRPRVVGG